MELFAAIHVPEKSSSCPAFIDDFGLLPKMRRIIQPLWWKRLHHSSFTKVAAVTRTLLRHRPLRDLHEAVGTKPFGKGALDILGVKFDVNASRMNPFIERQPQR